MSGGHGAEHGGDKKPGALYSWFKKGEGRRNRVKDAAFGRAKRLVKEPLNATLGNVKVANHDFYKEQGWEKDNTRGILEGSSNIIKKTNESVVDVLSWPIKKVWKGLKWCLKAPGRGIGLVTKSKTIYNANEKLVDTLSMPFEVAGKTVTWAGKITGRAIDHSVRAVCRTAGAIPLAAGLLLTTGVIGTQAEYIDAPIPAAAAHGHGEDHAAGHGAGHGAHAEDHGAAHAEDHGAAHGAEHAEEHGAAHAEDHGSAHAEEHPKGAHH